MKSPFINNNFYHIANFGIEGRLVFSDKKDVDRFIALLDYYSIKNPPARFAFRKRPVVRSAKFVPIPMVEVVTYCLMPDHFHLILKQLEDNGVSSYISKVLNSYTKYYNARQKRKGTLLEGVFKSRPIEQDQLSYISRHIHLEPQLEGIVINLARFPFSSYLEYIGQEQGFCEKGYILDNFSGPEDYKQFVLDNLDYKSTLPQIKDLLIEKS
jgi:putative transposase